MNLVDVKPGMRVAYVPPHADGNLLHPDVELGKVSSVNKRYAFVRFDKAVARFGWEGVTSQACNPADLVDQGGGA